MKNSSSLVNFNLRNKSNRMKDRPDRLAPIVRTSATLGGKPNSKPNSAFTNTMVNSVQSEFDSSASTDSTSAEDLRRRVSELSKENAKLLNRVAQTELSGHNYRGFQSNQADLTRKADASIQTDLTINQDVDITQSKADLRLASLEEQRVTLKRERDQLRILLQQYQVTATPTKIDAKKAEISLELVESLREKVSSLQLKLSHQKQRRIKYANQVLDSVKLLKLSLDDERKAFESDKMIIKSSLSAFSDTMTSQMSSLQTAIQDKSDENKRIMLLLTKSKESERSLRSKVDELQRSRAELSATVSRMESHLAHEAMATTKCVELREAGCDASPWPEPTPVLLGSSKPGPDTDLGGDGDGESGLDSGPSSGQAQQRCTDGFRAGCSDGGVSGEGEGSPTTAWQELYGTLLLQLRRASSRVTELEARAAAHVKAAKHEAHVRELQRISTLRELSLERDRAIAEVKHVRDANKVLQLDLDAAERHLSESMPDVVERLVDGRSKRLLVLDELAAEQRRDIDQRAAEADSCAASAAHLAVFQDKAERKQREAEREYHLALALLKDSLDVEDSFELEKHAFGDEDDEDEDDDEDDDYDDHVRDDLDRDDEDEDDDC